MRLNTLCYKLEHIPDYLQKNIEWEIRSKDTVHGIVAELLNIDAIEVISMSADLVPDI